MINDVIYQMDERIEDLLASDKSWSEDDLLALRAINLKISRLIHREVDRTPELIKILEAAPTEGVKGLS